MKIKTKKLELFLKEIRMEEIEECLLQFKEEGLYVTAMSSANTHQSKGTLKKEAFEEYEAIGNVGVDGLNSLILAIKKMGEELNIEIKGNLLHIKNPNKEFAYELVDEKYIKVNEKNPKLEHKTEFKVDVTKIHEFLNDAKSNTEFAANITTVNNGIRIHNEGKYKFTHNIDAPGALEGEKVKFLTPFANVMKEIKTGEITMKISTDYPMLIKHETPEYTTEFLIAPYAEKWTKK